MPAPQGMCRALSTPRSRLIFTIHYSQFTIPPPLTHSLSREPKGDPAAMVLAQSRCQDHTDGIRINGLIGAADFSHGWSGAVAAEPVDNVIYISLAPAGAKEIIPSSPTIPYAPDARIQSHPLLLSA